MKRLTTDTPKDNVLASLNMFYGKDHETWVRGGGEAPEYPDVSLDSYIRRIIKAHRVEDVFPGNYEDLTYAMADLVMEGPDSIEGLIATLYTAAWVCSELRERLKAYEDTGLEPEEVRELLTTHRTEHCEAADYDCVTLGQYHKAEQEGRLLVLPFVAMVEQSLQDGKMLPQRDQRFNGRYAVVYSAPEKWGCPLIDICGTHYDRSQAEERMAALAGRERAEVTATPQR